MKLVYRMKHVCKNVFHRLSSYCWMISLGKKTSETNQIPPLWEKDSLKILIQLTSYCKFFSYCCRKHTKHGSHGHNNNHTKEMVHLVPTLLVLTSSCALRSDNSTFQTVSHGHVHESTATSVLPNTANWQPFRGILVSICFFFNQVRTDFSITKFC